jgi:hypothetical protein
LTIEGLKLTINRWGIRDDSDDLAAGKRKIALVGDSVVFGDSHSQTDTIRSFLQRELDPSQDRLKILNFAVPGYGLAELSEWLKEKNAIYRMNEVIYLHDPNDFTRRNSVYEGADNGLYFMYRRPSLMSLWIFRKAIYRWNKGSLRGSANWYQWMFDGNRERGLSGLREMAAYAKKKKIEFSVIFLPVGIAYEGNMYALSSMYDQIAASLKREGVSYLNPVNEFASYPDRYFGQTDHLTLDGNALMAKVMTRVIRKK